MKFSIKDFFSKCDEIHSFLRVVTFTEDILIGKLHFLTHENYQLRQGNQDTHDPNHNQ